MHNLLPEKERRAISLDYFLRVVAVLSIGIVFAALVGSLLLLPAYGYLSARAAAAPQESSSVFLEKVRMEERSIALTSEMLALISASKEEVSPGAVVVKLRVASGSVSGGGIELLYVGYFRNSGEVAIRGTARTRDALISFGRILKADPLFAGVTVPVELLAKNKDISFELRGKLPAP